MLHRSLRERGVSSFCITANSNVAGKPECLKRSIGVCGEALSVGVAVCEPHCGRRCEDIREACLQQLWSEIACGLASAELSSSRWRQFGFSTEKRLIQDKRIFSQDRLTFLINHEGVLVHPAFAFGVPLGNQNYRDTGVAEGPEGNQVSALSLSELSTPPRLTTPAFPTYADSLRNRNVGG